MHRAAAVALTGSALALMLSGCAFTFPPGACSAVGWNNGVTVDAAAHGRDVFVQVCSDAGCSPEPGVEPTPETDASIPVRGDGGVFFFGFDAPDEITVRVYDGDVLLAETRESIEWTHSTDECGGPSTAPDVVLEA
ncbi:hypothetical protein [Microbacterium sp. 1.5R]|uniref:hypothetical protein n=1 Tax=Microbacterium sp. 1.5R TaxID=1916917 RepID=UPI0011A8FD1B|nr:hypothetical protein [Microbacterium sp. 1.5R]